MFYDDLTRKLNEEYKNRIYETESRLSLINPNNKKQVLEKILLNKDSRAEIAATININSLIDFLDTSKVFLIDERTLDSLHNVKHGNINYERSMKLPFPRIFFEFESPINFEMMDGSSIDTFGALYFRTADISQRQDAFIEKFLGSEFVEKVPIQSTRFTAHFFSKESTFAKGDTIISLAFDVPDLPNFSLVNGNKGYGIEYSKNIIYHNPDIFHSEKIEEKEIFADRLSENCVNGSKKKIDLALNLINYINAQNVVILKKERETHSPSDLARINRKRINDGKKPIAPLKPYYLIEIKKSYVRDEDRHPPTWSLNYRFWVRGHFRHYQDGACTWIEPYIKGPQNTPLKPNRWEMKYKNFKHLLENITTQETPQHS
jgi:hypothetical protein